MIQTLITVENICKYIVETRTKNIYAQISFSHPATIYLMSLRRYHEILKLALHRNHLYSGDNDQAGTTNNICIFKVSIE